jgi:hypothetical protein
MEIIEKSYKNHLQKYDAESQKEKLRRVPSEKEAEMQQVDPKREFRDKVDANAVLLEKHYVKKYDEIMIQKAKLMKTVDTESPEN